VGRRNNNGARPHLAQHCAQIFDISIKVIPTVGRPFAPAMAAKVDIDDMASSLFQTNGHIFPHFARLAKAMQQDNGRVVGRTNIIGLKPYACKALKFSYITKRHSSKPQILSNGVIF
jgi:hypothetical protein